MKIVIIFIFATIATQAMGFLPWPWRGRTPKESVMSKVTVRLVRKDWRPDGYDPGTDEPLKGFTEGYSELERLLSFFTLKYGYVKQPLIDGKKIFDDPNYNATLPTVILTHPIAIGESALISFIVGALSLRNLQKHYNVIGMHSPWLSWTYQTACAKLAVGQDPGFKLVAEAFATFLLDGINMGKLKPHQISFIGFSYSATLNAYIAREIQEHTGQQAHTIISLDAFQYNFGNPYFKQVSREDAMFVHMFHTGSRFGGTQERIGTVDIVVNNGFYQPGCGWTVQKSLGCSHRRSVQVFLYAIASQGSAVARRCDSWEDFTNCKCSDNPMLVVSFPVNEEAKGTYYIRTSGELPYLIGPQGAYCGAEEYDVEIFKEED